MIKRLLIISLLLFTAAPILQAQLVNAGKLLSYKKAQHGIEGKTTSAIFDVQVYSDNIIRVRISKNKSFNHFSYALADNALPAGAQFSVADNGNILMLSTNSVDVQIEKSPVFRLVFKNKQGDIINEDVKGNAFGTSFFGDKVTSYKNLQDGERFIGLGEALGNLDRRGTGVTLNNTDTYKYGDPRLPMYVSIPFYIGIHHRISYGIFYNNSYKSFFNFGLSTPGFSSVSFDGGDMDYFFLYDTSVGKIIEHYTSLTGRMQMPPIWSIGYHQSRCSYYPQEKVEWIAESFRKKKIPLDCIVLDADYQQGYQPFRVNKQRFPDMPGLAKKLAGMDIELTASVYPGVEIDSTYQSYTDGLKKDVFIKYADGSLFETEIAPLRCYLPDYTNPKTRNWWINKMKWLPDNGIHGYWNDMNEPAVGGSYLPDNLQFDFDGHKAFAPEAKNVYALQMARSSYEAAIKNGNGRRPFILTRSGFAGVQRYSAVWSGDNTSTDEGLLSGVLLNNQLGLSGISFCGYDVGGYIGDASKDLYKRWIQVGVFSPFCRNHREFYGAAGEPWAYGEEAEAISKAYVELRYRLMPYTYAAFYKASQTGMPVARSLAISYPYQEQVYNSAYQYQFMFGDAIMVAPVTSKENTKTVYLPKGAWYDMYNDAPMAGDSMYNVQVPMYKLPLYVKASSVIPMQTVVQSTKQQPSDTLFIHVFNGAAVNTFEYYEDAGDGMDYLQKGYCRRQVVFDPVAKQLLVSKQEGSFLSKFKMLSFVLHGFEAVSNVRINDAAPVQLHDGGDVVFDPLTALKDYYEAGFYNQLKAVNRHATKSVTVANNNEVKLSW